MRRILFAAAVAGAVLVVLLNLGRVHVSPRSPVAHEQVDERTEEATSGEASTGASEDVKGKLDPEPGVVVGRLIYDDSSPAAGLPVGLEYGRYATTSDTAGAFRMEVPPGRHRLYLGLLELEKFDLRHGQEHVADFVVPRGAAVTGTVLAAEDGHPLGNRWARLLGSQLVTSTLTREDGTFRFGWVPAGTYRVLVLGGDRRTESVTFAVAAAHVALRIEVPIATPLRLRFENLPVEWLKRIPLFIEIRDEADRVHTLRPSRAIGSFGGPDSIDLDPTGHPQNPLPTPVPGNYVLSLRHPVWPDVPYLEVPIESPTCGRDEVVVRIPSGARVVVSQIGDLALRLGQLGGLAIGPACHYLDSEADVVLPRVPAGRHTIWKTSSWSIVRIGEIDVPASGDVMYVVDRHLNAGIDGTTDGERTVRLLRATDDLLVASKNMGSAQIAFTPLAPGHYVLVVDGRRIPIALNANQIIDLGDEFRR